MRSEGELILGQWKMCPVELAYEGGTGRRQDCHWVRAWGTLGESEPGEDREASGTGCLGTGNDRIVHNSRSAVAQGGFVR